MYEKKNIPDFKILKNGTWEHKGSKISRKSLIKLFSDFLILENNNYYIATPYEKELVVVEDMPFYTGYIEVISLDKKQLIIFKLNTGQRIVCNSINPFCIDTDKKGFPLPYLTVRKNIKARISRSLYYELVELSYSSDSKELGFWSNSEFFKIENKKNE